MSEACEARGTRGLSVPAFADATVPLLTSVFYWKREDDINDLRYVKIDYVIVGLRIKLWGYRVWSYYWHCIAHHLDFQFGIQFGRQCMIGKIVAFSADLCTVTVKKFHWLMNMHANFEARADALYDRAGKLSSTMDEVVGCNCEDIIHVSQICDIAFVLTIQSHGCRTSSDFSQGCASRAGSKDTSFGACNWRLL